MLTRCDDAIPLEGCDILHIIPLYDLREHTPYMSCWCHPSPDDEEPRVMFHHSADGREDFEEGRRLPS